MLNIVFHFSTYCPSLFKHLSHLSTSFWIHDAKNDDGCCLSHWWMTAPHIHLAFSSSAQKDESLGAKSGLYGGCGKPSCFIVFRVRRAVCGQAWSCNWITPHVSSRLHFIHIAVLCRSSRCLQFFRVPETQQAILLSCLRTRCHHFGHCRHNRELGRSWRLFEFPLSRSLHCLLLIVINPSLINCYNPLQHCILFCLVLLQVVKRCHHLHCLLFRL